MKNSRKMLIISQLDETLRKLRPLRDMSVPPRGWIRAIRDALGMSGRQLADRLNVYKARTSRMEKDELAGAVSLKTMQRVAEALDCSFVYGFVPRTSLANAVRDQAKRVASKRMERASHTMALEDQALSQEEDRGTRRVSSLNSLG